MWRRLLVLTGLAALAAWFLRRHRAAELSPAAGIDPSEELRRRLEKAREREESPPVVDAEAEATLPPTDLDARRRDVHERARAAVDEMHGTDE